jgi:hypothetical protein
VQKREWLRKRERPQLRVKNIKNIFIGKIDEKIYGGSPVV